MAEPSVPRVPATEPDWADQAADAVVNVVDLVREKTTGQVLTAARAIVYGLIGVFAGLVALVLLTVLLVRVATIVLAATMGVGVWAAHLLIGVLFLAFGLFLWSKRAAPVPD